MNKLRMELQLLFSRLIELNFGSIRAIIAFECIKLLLLD
jgi:hypothetical protein